MKTWPGRSRDAESASTKSQTSRPRYDFFARNLATGDDIGASAAVFIDGEPVVDIWGGHTDKERTRPWERDTIVNNFSTTKTMTAIVALMLADRGELDLDAPVTKYWPEFAPHGKSVITTRMFPSHTAGMPGWTETMTTEDILDWEKATTTLARQAPWLRPGTVGAYHPITYGPLIGEVVRRITGKTLKAFFAEEVAGPLGADYHIGAPAEADPRVSPMIQGSPLVQPRIATWGASGGSTVFNDLDARITVAYVMNRHLEHGGVDPRGIGIVRAAYEGLLGGGHD